MDELKLYRVTLIQVISRRKQIPIDCTVLAEDEYQAVRSACMRAGFASITEAAIANEMDFDYLMAQAAVTQIEDRVHAVEVPFTEAAVDHALWLVALSLESLPSGIAKAVELWLASERLKRRRGELPDDLDVSWIPGLVRSFNDYHCIVIDQAGAAVI